MTDQFPVVIVGGGLAGLMAALHLAEQGIEPLVLEADSEWAGGRLSGGDPDIVEHQGKRWEFPTEHGMHALWGGYVNMRRVVTEDLGIELLDSQGEEWINRWGNQVRRIEAGTVIRNGWIPAPFHYLWLLLYPHFWKTITPLDFLSLPGFLTSILWSIGFDPILEQKAWHGMMLKDYFRLWTPNLKATFTGIGVNMLASNARDIHASAFIAAIRFYTLLRRDLWYLQYFPDNPQTALIQPMIAKIEALGGKVQFGARARQLIRTENGWQIRFEEARLGGNRTLNAEHVILALNPDAAQKLLQNSPDTPCQELRFPQVTRNSTVRLWFDTALTHRADGGMFTGDFTMDNFFWLHRIQAEFKAWYIETGGSCIEVHIYNRDAILDQSDTFIKILIANEVQMAFPELRGHLIHATYRSNGYHQTQFEVPTAQSLHVQTPWTRIYACGDWIGYPTPALWMERCTVTAIAAANEVLAKYGKTPIDILPFPEPELLVRGLGRGLRVLRRLIRPLVRKRR